MVLIIYVFFVNGLESSDSKIYNLEPSLSKCCLEYKRLDEILLRKLKVVIINDKLTIYFYIGVSRSDIVLLDRGASFKHNIIRSGCHIPVRYYRIGMSHSDMVLSDRGVTFRHGFIGSRCHVLTW